MGSKPLPPRIVMEGLDKPPEPGLYAVSASLTRGLPWRVYDSNLPGFPEWRASGELSRRAGTLTRISSGSSRLIRLATRS